MKTDVTERTPAEIVEAACSPGATYRELADGVRVLKAERDAALKRAAAAERRFNDVFDEPLGRIASATVVCGQDSPKHTGMDVFVELRPPALRLEVPFYRVRNEADVAGLIRQAIERWFTEHLTAWFNEGKLMDRRRG